jgi:hypothetical protein
MVGAYSSGVTHTDRSMSETGCRRCLTGYSCTGIHAARTRLERMGIIDASGRILSSELPPDMTADSDATL